MKHMIRTSPLGLIKLAACMIAFAMAQTASAAIPTGYGNFTFDGWAGVPLTIHTYRPETADANTPIVIVMHGVRRNADDYRDQWAAVAEDAGYIIAAPEFDAARFPRSAKYNLGGLGEDGLPQDSAFNAIEPLFDTLRQQLGSARETYYLYGHSAGGQFVHRFVYAKPEARIETAFAANAGWYTMPQRSDFPYGLKGSGLPRGTANRAFAAPLVILLGDEDVERGDNLRQTPEADAQGANRLIRGMVFFGTAASLAGRRDVAFCWRLRIVPGSGHSNTRMAWGVPAYLAATDRQAPDTLGGAARSPACDAR